MLCVAPTGGEFDQNFLKKSNALGFAGGGGGRWAFLDLTDTWGANPLRNFTFYIGGSLNICREVIYVIYRAGGPYGKKLCPRSWVRPEAEGRGPCSRPRAQFFSHTDRPRPVNNLFIFFYLFAFFANSADKNPDRSVSQKAGPVTSARLANQIRGFGIPARWDAFGKNKWLIFFPRI